MNKSIALLFVLNFLYSPIVLSGDSLWYVFDVPDNADDLKCIRSSESPFDKYIEIGGADSEIRKMDYDGNNNDFAYIIYEEAEAVSYFFSQHSRCELLVSMVSESLSEKNNTSRPNQQSWKVVSIEKQYSASYGGDEPYTVVCSNNSDYAYGVILVTDIGKDYGNICVSGGPHSVNICRGKKLWKMSGAAQEICGG